MPITEEKLKNYFESSLCKELRSYITIKYIFNYNTLHLSINNVLFISGILENTNKDNINTEDTLYSENIELYYDTTNKDFENIRGSNISFGNFRLYDLINKIEKYMKFHYPYFFNSNELAF